MEVGYQQTYFNFCSKISTEQKVTIYWQMCQNIFLISFSENHCLSHGNVSWVLATTFEILVAHVRFLAALANRKPQG